MKIITKTIAFLTLLMMLSTTIYANETKNVSFKATMDGENISVEETTLIGNVDNSNLQVKVIKQTGTQSEVIYVGSLGDYDNGIWSNVDFSDIQFLVLFDWNTMENEAVYIIPTASENSMVPLSITSSNETVDNFAFENLDSSLNVDVNIIYNNEFYEGALLQNNTLNVFITVSNSGLARNLVCYLAEYDSEGKLLNLTANNNIPVPANESVTANLTKTFTNSDVASAKIFLWENGNLKPITSNIVLQSQPTDYYADVYTSAQSYDISKIINGKINTSSDVDYIKFEPVESGKYVVHTNSTANVSGGLYDSQNNLIVSGVALNGGYYCGAELISGNTYYLKTNGTTVGEYDITITKMSDDGLVAITNDSIKLTQNSNSSQVNVSLISSGTNTQSVNVIPNNNKITAEFAVSSLQSAYSIIVMKNGVVTSIYDIITVSNSNTYDVTEKSYVSVPMTVSNVSDLSNIYFSVAFSENEFDVFDACEHTYTSSETGTGIISSAEVNIKAVEDNAVIFTSTKTLTNSWSGNINIVKLQAVDTGEYTVKTIAYSVK